MRNGWNAGHPIGSTFWHNADHAAMDNSWKENHNDAQLQPSVFTSPPNFLRLG